MQGQNQFCLSSILVHALIDLVIKGSVICFIINVAEYKQFQANPIELDDHLSLQKQWVHPIQSRLLFTGLPPKVSTGILDGYLETHDDVTVEKITLSDDKTSATVELVDTLSKQYNNVMIISIHSGQTSLSLYIMISVNFLHVI